MVVPVEISAQSSARITRGLPCSSRAALSRSGSCCCDRRQGRGLDGLAPPAPRAASHHQESGHAEPKRPTLPRSRVPDSRVERQRHPRAPRRRESDRLLAPRVQGVGHRPTRLSRTARAWSSTAPGSSRKRSASPRTKASRSSARWTASPFAGLHGAHLVIVLRQLAQPPATSGARHQDDVPLGRELEDGRPARGPRAGCLRPRRGA